MRKIFHPGVFLDTDKERVYVIELSTLPEKNYAEVMFMGDLHIGHKDFAPRFLAKYLSFLQKAPERRVVLMGDYFEHEEGTPYIKEQILDFKQQVAEFIKFFQPVSKQIVAMVYGNHDERYCKVTSSGVDLLDYLRLKIGNPEIVIAPPQRGLIIVFLVKKAFGEGYFAYPVYVLHSSTASIVNLETQFRRTADNFDVGLIVHAHTHKIFFKENTKFIVMEDEAGEFRRAVIRQYWLSSGSFLRFPSYGEAKCVDEDTEILTYNGWKKHWELREQEAVATYNLKTKRIEFQPLQWIARYNYNGPMILREGEQVSMLITPNHRVVLANNTIKEARDLVKRDKLLLAAPMKIKSNIGIGTELASLIGWIISEGTYAKNGSIVIYQNKGPYSEEIENLLKSRQIHYSKYERTRKNRIEVAFRIPKSSPYTKLIKEICPQKTLNHFLVTLPEEEAKALFDSLMKGDGSKQKDVFHQKSKETAEWFQILALRFGFRTILSKVKGRNLYRVRVSRKQTIGWENEGKYIHYKGIVWCPRVKNGTWVARRNGKVFITGNSYPVPDMGAPIIRFYSTRHALEYIDPRTTYGLDQEPFAETYQQVESFESFKAEQAQEIKAETEEIKSLVCPECGSYRVGSKGTEWICKVCGKRWVKNPRKKKND